MNLKLTVLSISLILVLTTCKKHNDNPNEGTLNEYQELIEVVTMDPNGVVFKILNDIDSSIYQTNFTTNMSPTNANRYFLSPGNETGFRIKIDSVCLKKFHYNGPDNLLSNGYTWFTKKGQYVCWRDAYTHEDVGYLGYKWLDLGFPNRHKNLFPERFCMYSQFFMVIPENASLPQFLRIFPKPINDTVYTRLSLFRSDKVW